MFLQIALAVAIYLMMMLAAQRVLEPGRRALSMEQKARVMDVSAGLRSASMFPPLVLVLVYGFAANQWPQHFGAVTLVIYALLISVATLFSVVSYRRIRALDMPGSYLQPLLVSQVLYIAALVFLCGCLSFYYGSSG